MTDPMEEAFIELCDRHGIRYERHDDIIGLDFYLPDLSCYVEVKQFHAPRIEKQLSRKPNVIVIQGVGAMDALVRMIGGSK